MKKVTLAGLVCLLALLLFVPIQAKTTVNFDYFSTELGDFEAKFWKEKFMGGGPGQPGNTLMAVVDGAVFQNAVLESTVPTGGGFDWYTVYEGGELTLNSQGPWLDSGKLRATDVTATNCSTYDPGTGILHFVLQIQGRFDTGEYFCMDAEYEDEPDFKFTGPELAPELSNVVFQRGFGYQEFDVEINISDSALVCLKLKCALIKP